MSQANHMQVDLHCHTIFSGHAFNTLEENVTAAKRIGIKLLGISDHGPSMEGASHVGYFEMGTRLPKYYRGIELVFGCEANIINHKGDLDLPKMYQQSLDYVMIGLHARTPYPIKSSSRQNTKAMIRALNHYEIDVITHPYTQTFPVDISEVLKAAKVRSTAIELNLSRLRQIWRNQASLRFKSELITIKHMLELADELEITVIAGSDAHHISELGCAESEVALLSNLIERDISQYLLGFDHCLIRNIRSLK
jgi:putative hydrolase